MNLTRTSLLIFILLLGAVLWWGSEAGWLTQHPLPAPDGEPGEEAPPPPPPPDEEPPPGDDDEPPSPPPRTWNGDKLNVVVIYTDDQRGDTLWAMPRVKSDIIAKGVEFTNSFITTPVCCPSRASFLGGGFYAFNTGVLTNGLPNGGATRFDDDFALPVWLREQGYATGMLGKYLNGYRAIEPTIPPGWSQFIGTDRHVNWWDYELVIGQSGTHTTGTGTVIKHATQYLTNYLRDEALKFIDQHANQPFFLFVSTPAPHKPATPLAEDKDLFSNYRYDVPSMYESDLSDKPSVIQEESGKMDDEDDDEQGFTTKDGRSPIEFIRDQLRSLQAVDRLVGAVVAKLEAHDLLDNTMIVFTSDNGIMWGEHGLFFKSKPYEESIRVPLAIRFPGNAVGKRTQLVASNLDVPATIMDIAGITKPSDGLSLYPLLAGGPGGWRDSLVFQIFNDNFAQWTAVRTDRYKYVEYGNGEQELYDLQTDPYELESQHRNSNFASLINSLKQKIAPLTGLYIVAVESVPKPVVGQSYRFPLIARGGRAPYHWRLGEVAVDGNRRERSCYNRLPAGLQLSSTGVIQGTPTREESCLFEIIVEDSSRSAQHGGPQAFRAKYGLTVRK